MRNYARLTFVLFLFTATITAQEFVLRKQAGFDPASGIKTEKTITIENKTFDLLQTKSGSLYIKCLSKKKGKFYPLWIGEKIDSLFEGTNIYKSKKGSYCIYKISPKTGNPYPVWLIKNK